jgi:hypothetical protein
MRRGCHRNWRRVVRAQESRCGVGGGGGGVGGGSRAARGNLCGGGAPLVAFIWAPSRRELAGWYRSHI